jgi:hypothetical protein
MTRKLAVENFSSPTAVSSYSPSSSLSSSLTNCVKGLDFLSPSASSSNLSSYNTNQFSPISQPKSPESIIKSDKISQSAHSKPQIQIIKTMEELSSLKARSRIPIDIQNSEKRFLSDSYLMATSQSPQLFR